MRYAILVEKAGNSYSAYMPDLPGCVATGSTIEETEREIREAIELHIEGIMEDSLPYRSQPALSNTSKFPHDRILSQAAEHPNGLPPYGLRIEKRPNVQCLLDHRIERHGVPPRFDKSSATKL